MSFADRFRSFFGRGEEKRSVIGEDSWCPPPSLAGVVVTEETATTFAAAYACITVLSSDLSAIPFQVMKREPGGGRSIDFANPIHDMVCHSPNEEMSAMSMVGSMMWHLQTHGNAYTKIVRDKYLRPESLTLLDPRKVIPGRKDGKLYYEVEGERELPADIIHVANVGFNGIVGKSPIRECREAVGLGMAVEKFGASYFGNGIHEKGILTTDQKLDEVVAAEFRKELNEKHQGPYNAHRFLLLHSGLKFEGTSIQMDDAQFLATRAFQLQEMCRIFRCPPTKVQDYLRANFTNLEETNADYYDSSLKPWVRRFLNEFNRKLFTKAERAIWTIEHDVSSLLTARIVDQANVDKIYREMGVKNSDEIRARQGLSPIKGGQTFLIPLNMAPLDKVAEASIETLKGVKAVAQETTDTVDAPVLTTDNETLEAIRGTIRDAARRMVRREANAVRNILKRKDLAGVLEGLDTHYRSEPAVLADAIGPGIAALASATRRSIDPHAIAAQVVDRSRAEILRCVESPGSTVALGQLVERWEIDKPSEILALLP